MTLHRERQLKVGIWVKRNWEGTWYFSIGRDGIIRGRQHIKRKTIRKDLGTVEKALREVSDKDVETYLKGK